MKTPLPPTPAPAPSPIEADSPLLEQMQRGQWLEGDGLVDRLAFDVVPPHVEYRLTPLGREAAERVQGLADWIETSLPRILQAQDERRGAQACAR